jgi:hypothetical protein
MSTVLALSRPTDWNFPLFLHVLGAMVLVGATLTGASALAYARGEARFLRLGYWTLLLVGLPAAIVMRIGAQWIEDKEGWNDLPDDAVPTWIDIGYIVADGGSVLFLIALVVGGVGVYRLRDGKGAGLLKVTLVLSLILLAAYLVAVWAMSGKPD